MVDQEQFVLKHMGMAKLVASMSNRYDKDECLSELYLKLCEMAHNNACDNSGYVFIALKNALYDTKNNDDVLIDEYEINDTYCVDDDFALYESLKSMCDKRTLDIATDIMSGFNIDAISKRRHIAKRDIYKIMDKLKSKIQKEWL